MTMTTRLVITVVAILVLVRKSHAFIATRGRGGPPMSAKKGRSIIASPIASAATSPLDRELESWSSSSGYGSIISSIPIGSSDWASFRKVVVSDPPPSIVAASSAFFVKYSSRSYEEMFRGEALGLSAMYHACSGSEDDDDALRIPKVYSHGDYSCGGKGSYLIMEYLNLAGRVDDYALGRAVARMHLAPPTAEAGNPTMAFGFPVDNTM
jgi:hypothetical protein